MRQREVLVKALASLRRLLVLHMNELARCNAGIHGGVFFSCTKETTNNSTAPYIMRTITGRI